MKPLKEKISITIDSDLLEKLKERAFEDFLRELSAQEAKEVDELTSYTYGQKSIKSV